MKLFANRGKAVKLTVLISIVMILALITGALYFRSSVYITDNGVVKEIKTNETSLEGILSDAGIELYDGDVTFFESKSDDNIYITIVRAFDVTVVADGKTHGLRMTGGAVSDALEEAGIKLGENDLVNFGLDEELYAGMDIKVSRVRFVNRSADVDIPYGTEYTESSNFKIGTEGVLSAGHNGVLTYTYRDMYIDGKYVSSEKLGEQVTKEPVNEVIAKGTSLQVPYAKLADEDKLTLVNGLPEEYVKVVSGKATAYSARAGSLTASNRYAVVGTVAVNPNVIPYGSELYIVAQDGSRVYGYAIAADTGLGLLDGRVTVDVFMGSYEDSCKWGAVYVDVYVLSMGDNRYISASER